MNLPIFLYGTLCDPELFEIVAGRPLDGRAAVAKIGDPSEQSVEGVLVEVSARTRDRLEFFLCGFQPRETDILCDGETKPGLLFLSAEGTGLVGEDWSLSAWQATHGALTREAAVEQMRLMATHSAEAVAQAAPQIRMRAASRLRARAHPSPQVLTPDMSLEHLQVHAHRQPYTDYFAVEEYDLAFPTFSGGMSETVTRASFLGGDAVTVLPYDPKLDCVLVIRQFRHGVFARGDTNPWTIEPAAGRIDPGEQPEDTVMRELREETGAEATELFKVAEYYPSPSAYSEFLYSYVALADLSGQDGTTAGLDSEHEDIMSHVIPFTQLMSMVGSGAANTAPLVLSALWLAARRAQLRGSD